MSALITRIPSSLSRTHRYNSSTALGPYVRVGSLGDAESAQQNYVSQITTTSGLAYLWTGDRWGSCECYTPVRCTHCTNLISHALVLQTQHVRRECKRFHDRTWVMVRECFIFTPFASVCNRMCVCVGGWVGAGEGEGTTHGHLFDWCRADPPPPHTHTHTHTHAHTHTTHTYRGPCSS
jgi:hypothetical protein